MSAGSASAWASSVAVTSWSWANRSARCAASTARAPSSRSASRRTALQRSDSSMHLLQAAFEPRDLLGYLGRQRLDLPIEVRERRPRLLDRLQTELVPQPRQLALDDRLRLHHLALQGRALLAQPGHPLPQR